MVVQAIGSALAADSETSNKDAVTVNEQGDIVGEYTLSLLALL